MTHPTLLALDTTTEACSVALSHAGELIERYEVLPRGHAQRILGMLDEVLAEAAIGLQAVAGLGFCRGPGAFTGVRIAVGVAQGVAYGADLGVAPISTLAALAQGGLRTHGAERVLSAVDARMGEVYWGAYAAVDGVMRLQGEEQVAAPAAVRLPAGAGWLGVGSGWDAHGEALRARCGAILDGSVGDALPRARDLLPELGRLYAAGELLDPAQALPVYLRDKVTG